MRIENQLQSTRGKSRLYKKIKNIFCYENYLELPFYLRTLLTKLRISNHSLRIEAGRYNILTPLPIDQLTCFSLRIWLKMSYTFCFTVIPVMIYKNIKIWFYISSFSTPILIHYLRPLFGKIMFFISARICFCYRSLLAITHYLIF